jgi:Uncharacterised nucleotidyltransferase
VKDASLLVRALRDPQSVLTLDAADWTALLTVAHAERLRATLAHRLDGLPVPARVAEILASARVAADEARVRALWEIETARRALAPLQMPIVLLKGSAFIAAGLTAGQGRLVGDLDILVPRERLSDVEAAVIAAGWEWLKPDPYDDHYYRTWMHELPPLIHRDRDAMIDVHHTILPLTARPRPDAGAMIGESVTLSPLPLAGGAGGGPAISRVEYPPPLASRVAQFEVKDAPRLSGSVGGRTDLELASGRGELRTLNPQDMVIHAAAHLLADGDMSGGLRNLWDIHCLLGDNVDQPDFWTRLDARAAHHGLGAAVARALRLSADLFGTPIPTQHDRWNRQDKWYRTRLLARDGWGRETRKTVRFIFYVRSHFIRMPLPLLARHLFTKWRKARASA